MCDWPVYGIHGRIDGARKCEFEGTHDVGQLCVCSKHLSVLVTGVLGAMRRQARQLTAEGRVTPGGIEEEMRDVLGDVKRTRDAARFASEGRPPCVYFAEREGYIKIGWTVNLAVRMAALASGGQMLAGMTAGPLTVLATLPGGEDEEKALHKRFRRQRVDLKREWFRNEGKLREYLDQLQAIA